MSKFLQSPSTYSRLQFNTANGSVMGIFFVRYLEISSNVISAAPSWWCQGHSTPFHSIWSILLLKEFFFLKHYRTHPDKQGETLKTAFAWAREEREYYISSTHNHNHIMFGESTFPTQTFSLSYPNFFDHHAYTILFLSETSCKK